MPRDDYFRLVFKVLTELYTALRTGERIEVTKITDEALRIPQAYWAEIMHNLLDDGYVKGYSVRRYLSGTAITGLEDIQITPKGIEYLKENNMMRKVFTYLKEIGELVPRI
ncbi:YjcQ protein [Eubacterium saphenum ATCC 49989]|nr:YjcQ protein [Eubacterium saphenum ATCC 49989]